MPPTLERRGQPAAPGIAAGPLVRLATAGVRRAGSGDPGRERRALSEAIGKAVAALAGLIEAASGDAAEILAFQVAMLEDEALSAPAFERIDAGHDAASAWQAAIDAETAGYQAADTDYFRARAADLRDIRDRVLRALDGTDDDSFPPGAVLVGEDVTPSRFLGIDWTAGGALALFAGSSSSHVAMLARARGVPMVVGLGAFDEDGHRDAIVDGTAGRVVLSPGKPEWAAFETERARSRGRDAEEAAAARNPAATAGGDRVSVMINIAGADELAGLDPAICDGIGLVRTEFLFRQDGVLPGEEEQYAVYRRVLEWAGSRPVVLRTLDAGGDKPIAGLTIPGESNPFLGTRGIRLSLARPDVFRVQLRAMARAAVHGNARIMLPMVTVPSEIDAAAALLDDAVRDLSAAGIACRRPPLGIMVEVPAVAAAPEIFARAAFFSIGSNDLTQYVTAAARDIAAVAPLNDPGHPAVTRLIRNVVEAGKALGREVSLCGDMGGEPRHIPVLIAAGLRSVSVAPRLVGRTKLAVAAARS
ncbi:MAG TPA: phosphoenolpyruvate--protein phosphotransferase [Bauldia sp.]|nr:phosphoenolpyruvate--protein phosphotransferase [Bauldia sp.]